MAQAPFDHVEAPGPVSIDGVLAFTKGDPVPLDTARRLGLTVDDDSVIRSTEPTQDTPFVDGPLTVEAVSDTAGTGTDTGEGTEAKASTRKPTR